MKNLERRSFCRGAAWVIGEAVLGESHLSAQEIKPGEENGEEISPAEDLMREHGVLNRVLLLYDEAVRRLKGGSDLDPLVLASSAGITRRFIEDYHEKLEEDYLFPRFEKAGRLMNLVAVLRAQHRAGRRLTDQIHRLATAQSLNDRVSRSQLAVVLESFIRMYRPHEAREDTVLFPAFRSIVTPNEYDSLGEEFEDKEHELFGESGFEQVVEEVATLEKKLGIYDLAGFTPAS